MSALRQTQIADAKAADSNWKSLYRVGGVAPLITLAFYLTETAAIIFGEQSGEPYPTSVSDWFSLFQRNRILGLLYINAPDVFSIALLGVMFLALYIVLKRTSESSMAIAAFFAFVGIPVFIAPRVAALSILSLSDRYAAATTEAQRATFLIGGETLSALGQATPQTTGGDICHLPSRPSTRSQASSLRVSALLRSSLGESLLGGDGGEKRRLRDGANFHTRLCTLLCRTRIAWFT
jgi:hypothetical protein